MCICVYNCTLEKGQILYILYSGSLVKISNITPIQSIINRDMSLSPIKMDTNNSSLPLTPINSSKIILPKLDIITTVQDMLTPDGNISNVSEPFSVIDDPMSLSPEDKQ